MTKNALPVHKYELEIPYTMEILPLLGSVMVTTGYNGVGKLIPVWRSRGPEKYPKGMA